jgi:hypothetical protein
MVAFNLSSLDFDVEAWGKFAVNRDILTVYIEGDGKAWKTRYKLSENPTPEDPLALKLASLDIAENVLYLARPCQYRSLADLKCQQNKQYWSSHRYSDEVIKMYTEIFQQLKKKWTYKEFHLIGYSGGGVIASFLTASRNDVTSLITIAANLDHQNWAKFHNVSELTGSMSLYSYLEPLSKIPQFHLFGKDDRIVPAETNLKIINNLNDLSSNVIHNKIIEGYNHSCCWKENWPTLLAKIRSELKI